MSVCVLGTGGTWWPPICCFSTIENSLSLKTVSGWGSAAHIHGADPWQIRWGKGSSDKSLPSSSLRGCVLSQACGWAGAGVALIAFSLCWPLS